MALGPTGPLIEVYADVWCPFAYVGLHELLAARAELGVAVPVVVRAWPLEQVNGTGLDLSTVLEEAEDLRSQVAPELFARVCTGAFPTTTLPALALTASAYQVDFAAGERVSMALRRALFEEGEDISDPAVLGRLAEEHAVPVPDSDEASELVAAEYATGRARGVRGSPHFFAGATDVFCPSLHLARDATGIRAELDRDRLRHWLSEALR